ARILRARQPRARAGLGTGPRQGRQRGRNRRVAVGISPRAFSRVAQCRDIAGDLAAFLDRELPVADLARDLPRSADEQLLAHRQLTLQAAANFGYVDARLAREHPALRYLYDPAVHRSLDAPLDDQGVAIGDLGALELDIGTYDQLARRPLVGSKRLRLLARRGRLRRFDPESLGGLGGLGGGRVQGFLKPAVGGLHA